MGKIEPIEMAERWWLRHLKSSIPDLPRAITELVLNSADSYKRMNDGGKIVIEYDIRSATCTITDNAEGMSRKKLHEVSKKYGNLTSGIEQGKKVGGAFGVGLKEACLRMEDGLITTIKDGKLTQRRIFKENGNPKTEEITFRNVTSTDREIYGIPKNGTQVKLKVPRDLLEKPERLANLISTQWLLIKILQNPRYKILFVDKSKGNYKELRMQSNEKDILKNETKSINYGGEEFKIYIKIFKLEEGIGSELFKGCPLILIYNEDVVAERLIIPSMENDLITANLRGEIYVEGFERLLSRDESVLDEKRIGIDRRHPFNKKVIEIVTPIVREIIKQNRDIKKPNFDTSKIISKLNNIAKQEVEEIDEEAPLRNLRPNNGTIGFYYSKEINLKEYEEKNVFLVINSDKISEDVKISVKSASGHIPVKITPAKISLSSFKSKKDLDPDLKYTKITLKGIEVGSATITAEANRYTTDLVVTVKHNEILDIKDMSFLPNKYDLNVDKKYGFLSLYLRKDTIDDNIQFITLTNQAEPIIKNIRKLKVSELSNFTNNILYGKIKVTHDAKIGDQTNITAEYGPYTATATVSIVRPGTKNPRGLFAGIQDEYNEYSDEIARVGEDKIIYVNKAHPVLRYYSSRDLGEKGAPYIAVYSDVIAKAVCRKIVDEKYIKNQLIIPDLQDPNAIKARIDNEIDKLYKKYGAEIHKWIIGSIGTIYVVK